jgi:hypothetical protein
MEVTGIDIESQEEKSTSSGLNRFRYHTSFLALDCGHSFKILNSERGRGREGRFFKGNETGLWVQQSRNGKATKIKQKTPKSRQQTVQWREVAGKTRQTAERANIREQRERWYLHCVCSIFNICWSRE